MFAAGAAHHASAHAAMAGNEHGPGVADAHGPPAGEHGRAPGSTPGSEALVYRVGGPIDWCQWLHIGVLWAMLLFMVFVAGLLHIEGLGYHYVDPPVYIVAYTAVSGALFVVWLGTVAHAYSVDVRRRPHGLTREEHLLRRVHAAQAPYRGDTAAAVFTSVQVWAISLALLWTWYEQFCVSASVTVRADAPFASESYAHERWFAIALAHALLHWLALMVCGYAFAQRHMVVHFAQQHSLGLLVKRDPSTSSNINKDAVKYEVRPLQGNELLQLGALKDGQLYLAGMERVPLGRPLYTDLRRAVRARLEY